METRVPVLAVEPYRYGGYIVTNLADDRTIYVQTDWDFPGLANSFGWNMAELGDCPDGHCHTDGTVDCPTCGMKAGEFIAAAAEYLDGEPTADDDPGYFD